MTERNSVAAASAVKVKFPSGVFALALALAGCGGGGGSTPPPASSGPRPPTIVGTTFTGAEDSSLTGRITLADPEGGVLQVAVTAQPTRGTLTGPDATGAFTYSPRANFYGSDAFSISVTDSQSLSASATIALTISSVNDAPTATGESAVTAPASPIAISVLTNDSDIEAQVLQPEITTQSPNGSAQVQPDGSVMFTPATGFAGTTQFQYRAVDAEGGASTPVTVDVNVRPLKSAVYYTAAGTDQKVMLNSPASTRQLSPAVAAGGKIQDLQVSANGRTVLWQVGQGGSSSDAWYYIDLSAADSTARFFNGSSFNTLVVLSPAGTHVLIPRSEIVYPYVSTVVTLQDLWSGQQQTIHSAPATDQVLRYGFSPDGSFIVYRTNSPSRLDTDVSYYRASLDAPASPTVLAHSFPTTEQPGGAPTVTPDGSRILFAGYTNNWAGPVLRTTRTDGSTNAQTVGPVIANPSFQITAYEISPTSRHAAFTYRNSLTPPSTAVASYVVDLESGAYAQVGTGFTVSDRVTTPAFSRDGTKIALGISSGSETAIYAASVQDSTVLTRVGSVHEGRVNISRVRYAAGDRIVYTADVRQTGVFEIYVAKDGQSQRLNADLGTSVFVNSEAQGFRLSSDGTTLAYVQPPTPAAPRDLFLVDVTTPGLPLKIGENVSTELFYSPAYAILD